jgi:hypothetical protein
MAISKDLLKGIENGDYSRIATLFELKHHGKESVTRAYVRLVLLTNKQVSTEKASDVLEIADKYLKGKKQMKRELIAA